MRKLITVLVCLILFSTKAKTQSTLQVESSTLTYSTELVNDIHFSPDSKLLASISSDKIIIWNIHSKTSLKTLNTPDGKIQKVKFSPDGKYLSCKTEGATHFWEVASWKKLKSTDEFWENSPIEFHPTETKIIGASKNRIVIYDFINKKSKKIKLSGGKKKEGLITDLEISADGERIYAVDQSEQPLRVYGVKNSNLNQGINFPSGFNNPKRKAFIDLSYDGKLLAINAENNPVTVLFDTKNFQRVLNLNSNNLGAQSSFATKCQYLLTFSQKRISLFNLFGSKRIFQVKENVKLATVNDGNGLAAIISPDEKFIAAISEDGKINLWDLSQKELQAKGSDESNEQKSRLEKYKPYIEKLQLPDYMIPQYLRGKSKGVSPKYFKSNVWKNYLKSQNYEVFTENFNDEKIPETKVTNDPYYYFFVVVKSKAKLSFTNPFELKSNDDGSFSVSDKELKRELRARGYKRFWLQGYFSDVNSVLEFQGILKEIFIKNGMELEEEIVFEADKYFEVLKPSLAEIAKVSEEIEEVKTPVLTEVPTETEVEIAPKEEVKKSVEPIVEEKETEVVTTTTHTEKVEKEPVEKMENSTSTVEVKTKVEEPVFPKKEKMEASEVEVKMEDIVEKKLPSGSKPTLKKVAETKVEKKMKSTKIPLEKSEPKESMEKEVTKKMTAPKEVTPLDKFLVSRGLVVSDEMSDEQMISKFKEKTGTSILVSLMQNDQAELARKLLVNSASKKIVNDVNESGQSILHLACAKGDYKLVDYILYRNPNIDIQDSKGWTPLHYAIQSGEVKLIKLLKRYRAKTSVKNNDGLNAIKFAKKHGTKEMVSILKK